MIEVIVITVAVTLACVAALSLLCLWASGPACEKPDDGPETPWRPKIRINMADLRSNGDGSYSLRD